MRLACTFYDSHLAKKRDQAGDGIGKFLNRCGGLRRV